METETTLNWKEYLIDVDEYQFSLYTKGRSYIDKRDGKEKFRKLYVGHYAKLENCLRSMIRLESTKHGSMELKEYIDLWRTLIEEMKKDLSEELSVLIA